MTKNEQTFISSDDFSKITYYTFTPETEPKAVIQISHGMCEHIARYGEFIDFITAHGYIVVGNDHLGHGKSARTAREKGFFGEKNGWRFLVRDVKKLTDIVHEKYPKLPIILFGHSMGSFIARCYLSWYGDEISAAIIMGTSGGIPKTAAKAATSMLTGIAGENSPLPRTQFAFYSALSMKFPDHTSQFDWITRDPEKIEMYKTDSLADFSLTAKAWDDIATLINSISADDWAYSVDKKLPLLLISGKSDPIGDFGKGVRAVFFRLKEAGVQDVALKLYPQARHELINEINRAEVFEDMLKWLNRRIKTKSDS